MIQHIQVNLCWDMERVSEPLKELNRIFSQKQSFLAAARWMLDMLNQLLPKDKAEKLMALPLKRLAGEDAEVAQCNEMNNFRYGDVPKYVPSNVVDKNIQFMDFFSLYPQFFHHEQPTVQFEALLPPSSAVHRPVQFEALLPPLSAVHQPVQFQALLPPSSPVQGQDEDEDDYEYMNPGEQHDEFGGWFVDVRIIPGTGNRNKRRRRTGAEEHEEAVPLLQSHPLFAQGDDGKFMEDPPCQLHF
jgi:hypothetical protein